MIQIMCAAVEKSIIVLSSFYKILLEIAWGDKNHHGQSTRLDFLFFAFRSFQSNFVSIGPGHFCFSVIKFMPSDNFAFAGIFRFMALRLEVG